MCCLYYIIKKYHTFCCKVFVLKSSCVLTDALSEHIQDVDERVRMQVVAAICGYAMLNPQLLPVNILKRVSERLRDTEVRTIFLLLVLIYVVIYCFFGFNISYYRCM